MDANKTDNKNEKEILFKVCNDYIEFLQHDDYREDKLDNYQNAIFEAALEYVFGSNIFDKVNKWMDE